MAPGAREEDASRGCVSQGPLVFSSLGDPCTSRISSLLARGRCETSRRLAFVNYRAKMTSPCRRFLCCVRARGLSLSRVECLLRAGDDCLMRALV